MANRHSTRYSAYTGGPDPLAPPVDLREAHEQIGQDVMAGTSPRRALSELLRRGTQSMRGADRLAAEANRLSPRKLSLMQLLHPSHLGQKFQVLHACR